MFVGNTIVKKILSSTLALLLNISGVSPLSVSSESAFYLTDNVYRLENDNENEGPETPENDQGQNKDKTPDGTGSNNNTAGSDTTGNDATNEDQNDPPVADPQNNGDDQGDDDPSGENDPEETYVYSFLSMDPVSIAEVVAAAGIVPAEEAETFVSGITALTVDALENVAVTQDETSYFITQLQEFENAVLTISTEEKDYSIQLTCYTPVIENKTVTVRNLFDAVDTSGSMSYTVTITKNGEPQVIENVIGEEGTDASGQIAFELEHDEAVDMLIPEGDSVEIEQAEATEFDTTVQTDKASDPVESDPVEGRVTTIDPLDDDYYVVFRNTPNAYKISISKMLDDVMIKELQTFNFSVRLFRVEEVDTGESEEPETREVPIADYEIAEDIVTDENGVAEFSLIVNNQEERTQDIVVPLDCVLDVTEIDESETHDTYISFNDGEPEQTNTIRFVPISNTKIKFTNVLKNMTVNVTKIINQYMDDADFEFTAYLKNGEMPIGDYVIYTDGETEYRTSNDPETFGQFLFTLRNDQSIELTVPLGSTLTVKEKEGDYETSVEYNGEEAKVNEWTISEIISDDAMKFFNKPRPICKIVETTTLPPEEEGDEPVVIKTETPFVAFRELFDYLRGHGIMTSTVEMIRDYDVPGTDYVEIPRGYNVTFTTAAKEDCEYPYTGEGDTATVRRSENFTSGAMFYNRTSSGVLNFRNIIIDGGSVTSDAALIVNGDDAKLNITDNTTIRNGRSTANGGGINSSSGTITMRDSYITGNRSEQSGGGIYFGTGTLTVTNMEFDSNSAVNGGAMYSYAGNIIIKPEDPKPQLPANETDPEPEPEPEPVEEKYTWFTNNSADEFGGAMYIQRSAVKVTNGRFNGNAAVNGGAVFDNAGSFTTDNVEITGNTASNGGAVGAGSDYAKLYFTKYTLITENMLQTDVSAESNVYLDVDSDTIINSANLSEESYIGVYVPGDMTSELFIHRGQTGATFGTYTTDNNISHFTNDRLELQAIGNSVNKKILWGKTITVSVYYLNKFNGSFPGKTDGVWGGSLKYTDAKFFLSSESNNLFDIAQRITNRGSATAVYAFGYANTEEPDVPFESYLKEIDWNFDEGHWDFVTWAGDRIESNELVLYFSEPAYITFENNTDLYSERTGIDITDAALTILGVNTVENGYGYVVSEDGALLPEPRVITQEDIDLSSGKSIQIMFPGAVNQNYVLTGRFTGDAVSEYDSVVVERTNQEDLYLTPDEIRTGYSITGKTSSQTGATHSILFGGKRPVCKITDHLFVNESDAIQFCEDHNIDPGDIEVIGEKYKVDYEQPFMKLNDAKTFAETYLDGIAEVEMLIDYVIPASDVLVFETVNNFTITTAARNGGTYNYRGSSTETTPRALISRDPSNKQSFILIQSATAASNFTLKNLILDGKNISGKTDGGALKSLDCDVNIENTDIKNFRANEGGGIYIQFARGNGTLTVASSNFTGCVSESNKNRNGGGAIWTNAETMNLNDSLFEKCTAYDQGGAVFHRIDSATEYRLTSASYIDNCIIKDCNAHAAGGVELDSYNVTILNSHIENCHGTMRNAGGANVYIQPDDPDDRSAEGSTTYPVYVRVENSEFIDCSAVANGGGMRIVATEAVVKNSIFRNNLTSKNSGGGIAFTNIYGTKLEVTDCQFTGNSAAQSGGAIYDFGKEYLLVEGTTITGNSAGTKGGGISSESNVTLRNDTKIENNRVRTALPTDAGGIYILNERTLTIGDAAYKDDTSHIDMTTVRNNICNGDVLSDIRLPEVRGKNETTSISVLCQIGGDLYVANAKEKGDQFGSGLVEDLRGLTEQTHVFKSDNGKLFGAIDRLDTNRKKLIWYGEWICKITDASNNILFIDPDHKYPAVYDSLDVGTTSVNNYSAFGVLKANSPALYTASGQKYIGNEYLVQMIVPYYTVNKYVSSIKTAPFSVTLMTASKNDSVYPYEGETDAAVLERGLSLKDSSLLTAKLNMTIKDIIFDGNNTVTANNGGLLMLKDNNNITVTIEGKTEFKDVKVITAGGGICVNSGKVVLKDGVKFENCSSKNGGGIAIQNGSVSVTIEDAVFNKCVAVENGGAIYHNAGTLTINDAEITNCSAKNGGAVYVANNRTMNMNGGSITNNVASATGGAIAVGGTGSRLVFNGSVTVSENKANSRVCNVELGYDSNEVIRSTGLENGSSIGIYVPDGATLYNKHGQEGQPFGRYTGVRTDAIYSFVNDRNGLKGGIITGGNATTVYWVRMLSLEVSNKVVSDYLVDKTDTFEYVVTLTPPDEESPAITGIFGGMHFVDNVATFSLQDGQTKTGTDLPKDYGYKVTEILTMDQMGKYKVNPITREVTGTIGENIDKSNASIKYTSKASFTNNRVVCKLIGEDGKLLFYRDAGSRLVPAVYSELPEAFSRITSGYVYNRDGSLYRSSKYNVEMIVPDYTLKRTITIYPGSDITLTTAKSINTSDSLDYYRYLRLSSGRDNAAIMRGFSGDTAGSDDQMFILNGRKGTESTMSLTNIILDGNKANYTARGNGAIAYVGSEYTLNILSGANLRNSLTESNGGALFAANGGKINLESGLIVNNESIGSGAGIYLTEGSELEISGNSSFGGADKSSGNHKRQSLVNKTNGGEAYVIPRQDIYLADTGEIANAIHITGNITGTEGSIWVWPEETMEHRKSEQQFAIKDPSANLSSATYKVFRNALPDDLSENIKEAWLTGAKKPKDKTNSLIIWSDRLDRRHVVLIKLDEEGKPMIGPKFTIHEGIASYPYKLNIDGEEVKLENLTELDNGIFFMGVIPYGTYTVHETDIPEGYVGHGYADGLWYTLVIDDEGAALSEPRTEQQYPESTNP